MLIAIDGPAGAGKSTVAKALAARLGYTYLDSGAMYRCVALSALRAQRRSAGGEELDEQALAGLADALNIELGERVLMDGEDVTEAIRAAAVAEMASQVAAIGQVRQALVAAQRQLIATGDWVAEGRDIGTVVAPDSQLKIYLTAAAKERAARRAAQLGANAEQVLAEQALRDARDAGREHSPLQAAPDAVQIDSSSLSVDQVIDRILELLSAIS